MILELKIGKELGTLQAALGQWSHLYRVLNSQMSEGEFFELYSAMFNSLLPAFKLAPNNLRPLFALQDVDSFQKDFTNLAKTYGGTYLNEASKPRHHCEQCHEYYIELSTQRLIKTSFPVLKRNFSDLYEYIDKWVTNDAWITMGIDIILKYTQKLMLDLDKLRAQDEESAWIVYRSAALNLLPLLDSMELLYKHAAMAPLTETMA